MPASRILWLDGARAALMLLGVVLHAAQVFAEPSTWLVRNDGLHPGFSVLVWIIHNFRMPAFFIIAGFFCAYAHRRFGQGGFLRNRLSRIGIPLVATALTFNLWQDMFRFVFDTPAGSVAAYVTEGRIGIFFAQGFWQVHLWFLTFLILYHLAYAAAAPAAVWRGELAARLARAPAGLLGRPIVLALTCLAAPLLAKLVPALWTSVYGIFTGYHLLFHAPFFLFGVLALHRREVLDAFVRFRPADLPLVAGAGLVAYHAPQLTGTVLDVVLEVYAAGLFAWLMARLLFAICRRAITGGWLARYLSDASFSFYLSHHFLIVVGGWLLAQVAWPLLLEYLLLVVAVSAIAIALHHFLVLRHPLLGLLFNGRMPRAAPAAPAPR